MSYTPEGCLLHLTGNAADVNCLISRSGLDLITWIVMGKDAVVTGAYVDEDLSEYAAVTSLLKTFEFDRVAPESLLYRNTRNAVYEIELPGQSNSYIIKRSLPDPDYTPDRILSFYLRNFFKHYGRRAMRGAKMLKAHGIPSIEPVAYWKLKLSTFQYQSCFLYRKLDADYSVREFLEQEYQPGCAESEQKRGELLEQMIGIIQRIHGHRLRHLDLIVNNFLVKEVEGRREMYVIDTDHMRYNWMPGRSLKRLVDLRCFCRMNSPLAEQREFLQRCYGRHYREHLFRVLQLWRWIDRRPLKGLRWWVKSRLRYRNAL